MESKFDELRNAAIEYLKKELTGESKAPVHMIQAAVSLVLSVNPNLPPKNER